MPTPDPTGNPFPHKDPPPVPAAPIQKPDHPKGDDGPTDEQVEEYQKNHGL